MRLHFAKFIPALRQGDVEKAQLGLGHSYSRAKVKFNVNRVDNMIIQAISLLDQLDKDINTFSMRAKYVLLSVARVRICKESETQAANNAELGTQPPPHSRCVGFALLCQQSALYRHTAYASILVCVLAEFDAGHLRVHTVHYLGCGPPGSLQTLAKGPPPRG